MVLAALLLGLMGYVVLQVAPLWGWVEPGIRARSHQNDFKHLYLGAWLLSHGESPYDLPTIMAVLPAFAEEDPRFGSGRPGEYSILPYVYLPFTGQVLRPLTALSFDQAAHAWMIINHLLLLGGVYAACAAAGWRPGWHEVLLLAGLLALNATLMRQNNAGQLNAVLLAGYAVVFLGVQRKWHPGVVGGIAGFLVLFKLTPGIMLVYFLCTRRWLHAAWMAGAAVVLTILGVLASGPSVWLEFLPVLRDMGYGKSTWSEFGHTFWRDAYNQSPNSFLHHVLVPWPGFQPWFEGSAALANALTVVLSVVLVGTLIACLLSRNRPSYDERPAFALAVLTSLLVPSICWDHYLVQAILPLILLWSACRSVLARGLLVACAVMICVPVAFGDGVVAGWGVTDPARGAGLLVMSFKLWPLLALWFLAAWQCLRKPAKTPDSSK
jgi:hypothetical protein